MQVKRYIGLAVVVGVGMVAIRCSSSTSTDDGGVDASNNDAASDVGVKDVGVTDSSPTDAGSDVVVDAEAPCVDGGTPYVASDASGVQCFTDGGLEFCATFVPTECCGDTSGNLSCIGKNAGCGTETTFECDKGSDCDAGTVCCMKNVTKSTKCTDRVFTSEGTYCAGACSASDIPICNGGACVLGKTCTTLQVESFPGKILSGCL